MVARRPLVTVSGINQELPLGDTVIGTGGSFVTAGSGLYGGGDLTSNITLGIELSPNPSGLIITGDKLGVDGVSVSLAENALASGLYALNTSVEALASGVAAVELAAVASASGTAAFNDISSISSSVVLPYTATTPMSSGTFVGLDDTGGVAAISSFTDVFDRTYYSRNAWSTSNTTKLYGNSVISKYGPRFPGKILASFVDTSFGNNYPSVTAGSLGGNDENPSLTFSSPLVISSTPSFTCQCCDTQEDNMFAVTFFIGSTNGGVRSVPVVMDVSVPGFLTTSGSSFSSIPNAADTTVGLLFNADKVNFSFHYMWPRPGDFAVMHCFGNKVNGAQQIAWQTPTVIYSGAVSNLHATSTGSLVTATFTLNSNNQPYSIAFVNNTGTPPVYSLSPIATSGTWTVWNICYDSDDNRVYCFLTDSTGILNVSSAEATVDVNGQFTWTAPVPFPQSPTTMGGGLSAPFYDEENEVVVYQGVNVVDVQRVYSTTVKYNSSTAQYEFSTPKPITATNSPWIGGCYMPKTNIGPGLEGPFGVVTYVDGGSSQTYAALSNTTPSITPTVNGYNNYIGVAQTVAASGQSVDVLLPGSFDSNQSGLEAGITYYLDPTVASGVLTTSSTKPAKWVSPYDWKHIGRATSSSSFLMINSV